MSKLDLNQVRFVVGVSTATKIDPRVVISWMEQEGANTPGGTGGFNYLNLRPFAGDPYKTVSTGGFEQFASVNDAVKATVRRLNQPFAKPIVATARTKPTPAQQINAIASTGWDAGHYGGKGGVELQHTFSNLFKGGLQDSYLDPGNARAVANTVSTGSAADAGSYDANNAASDAGNALNALNPFKDISAFIKWIGGNWDRILLSFGGILLVLLGLVLIAGKQRAQVLNPATKFPAK